jgi:hypothetical protein
VLAELVVALLVGKTFWQLVLLETIVMVGISVEDVCDKIGLIGNREQLNTLTVTVSEGI